MIYTVLLLAAAVALMGAALARWSARVARLAWQVQQLERRLDTQTETDALQQTQLDDLADAISALRTRGGTVNIPHHPSGQVVIPIHPDPDAG